MVETIRRRPSWPCAVLAAMVAAYAMTLSYLSILRHQEYLSGAYDLGIFDQALWLISRGETPWIEFRGLHILGDHAAFVLYLLAPLYWIRPDVRLLLIAQSLILGAGAIPVYLLSRKLAASSTAALCLAAAYLLYPALSNMNLFHFHPECIAVPALLGAAYAAAIDRPGLLLAACVLAMSCKEIIALPVAVWAACLWWRHRRTGYLYLAMAATIWLVGTLTYFLPALSGAPPAALERYQRWGSGYWAIVYGFLAQPAAIVRLLWWRWDYPVALLLPLGFLPLLAPVELLPALPVFLLNLMSDRELQHSVFFQYNAAILPFLWLAVLAAWRRLGRLQPAVLAWLMICSLTGFCIYAWNGFFHPMWQQVLQPAPPPDVPAIRRALALIPPSASVLTDQRLLPHLTHRPRLRMAADYLFPTVLDDDYLVLNPNPRLEKHLLTYHVEAQLVEFCRRSPAFRTLFAADDVYAFQRLPDRPAPTFMYRSIYRMRPGPVPH